MQKNDLSSSPARKRRRLSLSSPTYDEQLSQEDLNIFNLIDAQNIADSNYPTRKAQIDKQLARERRAKAIADALSGVGPSTSEIKETAKSQRNGRAPGNLSSPRSSPQESSSSPIVGPSCDLGDPFTSHRDITAAQEANCAIPAFTSALQVASKLPLASQSHARSPSPEVSPEVDYSSWFDNKLVPPTVDFQAARIAVSSSSSSSPPPPPQIIPMIGFLKASHKGYIAPSIAALTKAEEKMKLWQDSTLEESSTSIMPTEQSIAHTPQRPILRSLENSYCIETPETPSPAGLPKCSSSNINLPLFSTPSLGAMQAPPKSQVKPFKSPLMNPSAVGQGRGGYTSSPLNPSRSIKQGFASAGAHHPLASTPSIVAHNNLPIVNVRPTPVKKPKFATPFKAGMKPGEPGRSGLNDTRPTTEKTAEKATETWLTRERQEVARSQAKLSRVFSLSKPLRRTTLLSSGLVPQSYDDEELEVMGINIAELSQISPTLALYYSFHTPSATPVKGGSTFPSATLGSQAALELLRDKGCSLATKPWVDNHWCLILWKLAGMVALDPERESDHANKKWCWGEVIRQLLYRYEREINSGSRPALRLIATQDAPASLPMVLCVSNVAWSEAGLAEDGTLIEAHPELEVTDGWYRLRAQVDLSLARAIRRGILRVGRKIAVQAARLSSERKDPMEILEAYNSIKLVLSGNSSHLAPWHAKLGFQNRIFIATLNSLSPDGGLVAALEVVVTNVYSVAYIEFIEDDDGKKRREGPRNEKDEAKLHDQWKRRREIAESKLRDELARRFGKLASYAERLEQRAGDYFKPGEDDSPPDHIENLYDDLESASDPSPILSRRTTTEAGWLARYIRERIDKDREQANEEIERELQTTCPPREVRNFRVLVVQDARCLRRPPNRTAQLTVWDVLSLSLTEGGRAGAFEVGHTFRVTNLLPTQQGAWMDRESGSEVFLCTRRDSRWTRIQGEL